MFEARQPPLTCLTLTLALKPHPICAPSFFLPFSRGPGPEALPAAYAAATAWSPCEAPASGDRRLEAGWLVGWTACWLSGCQLAIELTTRHFCLLTRAPIAKTNQLFGHSVGGIG